MKSKLDERYDFDLDFDLEEEPIKTDDSENLQKKIIKKRNLANTLDYYNDDMSRKAVGKLFENIPSDDTGFDDVTNFYSETGLDCNKNGEIVTGFENNSISSSSLVKKSLTGSTSRRMRTIDPNVSNEEEYEFHLYRRKGSENIGEDSNSNKNYITSPPSSPSHQSIKKGPENEGKIKSAKLQKNYKQNIKKIKHKENEYNDITPKGNSIKRSNPRRNSSSTVSLSIFVFFVSLVIGLLVYQLTTTNKKLEAANSRIQESNRILDNYSTMSIQITNLKDQIEELTGKLNAYQMADKDYIAEGDSPQGNEKVGNTITNPSDTANAQNQQNQSGSRVYKVELGDSLSKISKKFYNDINSIDKIKKANNLTSDVLKAGQVLKIPD